MAIPWYGIVLVWYGMTGMVPWYGIVLVWYGVNGMVPWYGIVLVWYGMNGMVPYRLGKTPIIFVGDQRSFTAVTRKYKTLDIPNEASLSHDVKIQRSRTIRAPGNTN